MVENDLEIEVGDTIEPLTLPTDIDSDCDSDDDSIIPEDEKMPVQEKRKRLTNSMIGSVK